MVQSSFLPSFLYINHKLFNALFVFVLFIFLFFFFLFLSKLIYIGFTEQISQFIMTILDSASVVQRVCTFVSLCHYQISP